MNLINDHRTIQDIGITVEANVIQIIEKPVFVALLEMVADIDNIENIPWFNQAMECLSDPSNKQSKNEYGYLIGIDLSHLDLTGTVH